MPWCDPCAKFYSPNAANVDGTCPVCETALEAPVAVVERNTVPWHFWVLMACVSIYLGWRAIQGIIALIGAI
jgi:hypothetical protein